ncbi:MAG: CehA/McbA family metallohydrolase [Phycisphaerae bacterium]|nr:CehA/McbA family metallohydrolase [Phycisphaerae bacterium]
MHKTDFLACAVLVLGLCCAAAGDELQPLTVTVVNADTQAALPCRVYVQGEEGTWHFARSASAEGSAVAYRKQNQAIKNAVEMHTTVSAHPFVVDLPPGTYRLTIERGKEYFSHTQTVVMQGEPLSMAVSLRRWIDMAAQGWYSGDTHVHRTLQELPNVQLAEDLNVSFPLTYWVTKAFTAPAAGDKSAEETVEPHLIVIDPTHVIYPVNTEYEIFSVADRQHTLGAVFILNHKTPFEIGAPPVGPVAEMARLQGGLLELDKHNWPWSMMLPAVMGVDLFELANNHMWRTEFAFTRFGEPPAEYMKVQTDDKGFTEQGWIHFGFETYYALVNCGFWMRPTAGTASGVHPVPLGFGRVYVKMDKGFNYDAWVEGLNRGRSFVTTGPMLMVTADGLEAGCVLERAAGGEPVHVRGAALASGPLQRIEIVVNGEVVKSIDPENTETKAGARISRIDEKIAIDGTSWIAVRCFESESGRVRFAHTGLFRVNVPDRPLRPRKEQAAYLVSRVEAEIKRNEGVLSDAAMQEYAKAMQKYREIAKTAR